MAEIITDNTGTIIKLKKEEVVRFLHLLYELPEVWNICCSKYQTHNAAFHLFMVSFEHPHVKDLKTWKLVVRHLRARWREAENKSNDWEHLAAARKAFASFGEGPLFAGFLSHDYALKLFKLYLEMSNCWNDSCSPLESLEAAKQLADRLKHPVIKTEDDVVSLMLMLKDKYDEYNNLKENGEEVEWSLFEPLHCMYEQISNMKRDWEDKNSKNHPEHGEENQGGLLSIDDEFNLTYDQFYKFLNLYRANSSLWKDGFDYQARLNTASELASSLSHPSVVTDGAAALRLVVATRKMYYKSLREQITGSSDSVCLFFSVLHQFLGKVVFINGVEAKKALSEWKKIGGDKWQLSENIPIEERPVQVERGHILGEGLAEKVLVERLASQILTDEQDDSKDWLEENGENDEKEKVEDEPKNIQENSNKRKADQDGPSKVARIQEEEKKRIYIKLRRINEKEWEVVENSAIDKVSESKVSVKYKVSTL